MHFRSFLILLCAAPAAFAQNMPQAATGPSFTFGVVGVAPGQVARLHVLNSVRTPPPVMIPQVPCKVNLAFYDTDGKRLVDKTFDDVEFGKAVYQQWPELTITSVVIPRQELYGVVRIVSGSMLFCSLVPTLEVFDFSPAGGKATIVLAGPALVPIVPRPAAAQP
ncbi:MAG: hypothetical protein HY235_14945 [Acidobacteria bacterium]|nr:hypothetical protein [Acidobacteriota bacterium]